MDFVLSILDFFDTALVMEKFPTKDFNAKYFGMKDYHFNNIIKIMIEDGLITGCDIGQCIDGKINIILTTPVITIKGIEFLNKYSK